MLRRWIILLALGCALGLAACQASVAPDAASKTSFDRAYELSPTVSSYVSKAFFAQRPSKIAVLPFVFRPKAEQPPANGHEARTGEGLGEAPKKEELPSEAMPKATDGGPLVSTLGDQYAPGGFSPDAELVRRAFFGQFATLAYSDVDIHEVDRRLREAGIVTPEQLESADPHRLGSLLGADAVIFGTVHEISVAYLVMYSQIAIGVSLRLVSTRDGEVLWSVDDVGRKHNIQLALGPVGLVTGAVRSALALRPINVTRTAEDLSRDVVQTFPSPSSLASYSSEPYEILALEADSSPGVRRYGEEVSVRMTGTPDRRGWFDLAPLAQNVPLQETEPGLYTGHYVVREGDFASSLTLTAFMGPKDSPQYYRWVQKRLDLLVDTLPPAPPGDFRTRREGRGDLIVWRPSPSGDLKEYRLYRKALDGGVVLVGTTDGTSYLVADSAGWGPVLLVTAVDRVGNESAGAEVLLRPEGGPRY